jgi:putative flippase GtrA
MKLPAEVQEKRTWETSRQDVSSAVDQGGFLRLASQVVSFGVIGVINNVVLYGVYLLLTFLGVNVLVAMTLVFCAGVLLSWFLNGRFTFKRRLTSVSAKRMGVAYLVAYLANVFFLGVSHYVFYLPHEAIQGVIMVLLAVGLFFAQRHWVFRHG